MTPERLAEIRARVCEICAGKCADIRDLLAALDETREQIAIRDSNTNPAVPTEEA